MLLSPVAWAGALWAFLSQAPPLRADVACCQAVPLQRLEHHSQRPPGGLAPPVIDAHYCAGRCPLPTLPPYGELAAWHGAQAPPPSLSADVTLWMMTLELELELELPQPTRQIVLESCVAA